MITKCLDWIDDRTGYRRLLSPAGRRLLPTGPSWLRVTGSCLFWLLVIEAATGLVMMGTYCPSPATAWASVHFIESAPGGAFIRGLHFWCAQGLIVLGGVHLVSVLLAARFRQPNEIAWLTGVVLLPAIVVWAVTGNPLAGSQDGYAQIDLEARIAGSVPIVGPPIARLLLGGDEVGVLTMTHLYFLHVAIIPIGAGLILLVHLWQIRRHRTILPASIESDAAEAPPEPMLPYFPYQTIRNMLVLTVLVAALAHLAFHRGAPLHAPADPLLSSSPRPVWYFLFLYELRRYFVGNLEFVATVAIPGACMAVLLSMPWIHARLSRRSGMALRWCVAMAGVGGLCGLTALTVLRDANDPEHGEAVAEAERLADRARQIASQGAFPPEGAVGLLRGDPKTQGPALFARHCAGCHSHADRQGGRIVSENPTAPNLFAIGTAGWIYGWLVPERIAGPDYYGNTHFADDYTDMLDAVVYAFEDLDAEETREARDAMLEIARTLAAEARLPSRHRADEQEAAAIARGVPLLDEWGCIGCHKFHDQGELGDGPDLTGYVSREWLAGFIADPEHPRFYPDGINDRMPKFRENPYDPVGNLLTERELWLLVDWLRGDWFEPKAEAEEGP